MNDEAIPAATLITVRDRDGASPELLMVERAEGMAFAAGALVFPGGRIDADDRAFAQELGIEAAALAAIRETIEETAIPAAIAPLPDPAAVREMQRQLIADRPFTQVLAEVGAEIDAEALTAFARWVPKFHAVRRFDTMFYVARCPAGDWLPNAIAGECSGAFWVAADEVLERDRRGEARLIFPTRRNLERLAQHSDFAAIRDDARAHPIEPVTPWIEERDGTPFITIPDHLGYPVVRERLDGLWRG